jgi:hypothetical protein
VIVPGVMQCRIMVLVCRHAGLVTERFDYARIYVACAYCCLPAHFAVTSLSALQSSSVDLERALCQRVLLHCTAHCLLSYVGAVQLYWSPQLVP